MLFLADENIPRAAVKRLRQAGHDVLWATEAMPGAKDRELLRTAEKESRVIITLDKDFGGLVRLWGLVGRAGVVLFRMSFPTPGEAASWIGDVLMTRDDWAGHFSVVTQASLRMRPLVSSEPGSGGPVL